MAEKKKATKKEEVAKKTTKKASVKTSKSDKKLNTKASKTKEVKKEIKEVKPVTEEVVVEKEKKNKKKKEHKFRNWFNKLTLEQIVFTGIIVIAILLIVLIVVSTKNTKTSKGKDIVAKVNGKTITADMLYDELKDRFGKDIAISLIDEYILEKEYKTTDDMKKDIDAAVDSYKNTYGGAYQSFLDSNGIKDTKELKEILLKNEKIVSVTEDYIKETLTEKEMKDYYESDIKGDVSVKHILISTETDDESEESTKKEEAKKKAEEIIEKLKNGEKFEDLAKEYSDDKGTKENGGDLGYFNTGEMVQEFEDASYKLEVNEYTKEPIETTYGYHIILKTGQKDKPSYEKSKDTIIEKLIDLKMEEDETISVKAMIALREKYKLNIKDKKVKSDYNDYKKEATTTTTTASSK